MMNEGVNNARKHTIIIYVIVFSVVILDQLTKYIIKMSMDLYDSVDVLGSFFKITYIENPGMAFGIQMENKIWFTFLSIIAAIIVLIYLVKMKDEKFSFRLALAMIMGGAVGNLIDRIYAGRVVDFLDVEFFDISIPSFNFIFLKFPGYSLTRWPVFNVADSAVTCGMLLIIWLIVFQRSHQKQGIIT